MTTLPKHVSSIIRAQHAHIDTKMALPEPPEDLCFSPGALIEKDFNVDEFVSAIRKRVTIECLREDLDSYFKALKNAMVELINKDYADFVALSANLVSRLCRVALLY